jgi:hypothetical protein
VVLAVAVVEVKAGVLETHHQHHQVRAILEVLGLTQILVLAVAVVVLVQLEITHLVAEPEVLVVQGHLHLSLVPL